jgi:hypothetical protein
MGIQSTPRVRALANYEMKIDYQGFSQQTAARFSQF